MIKCPDCRRTYEGSPKRCPGCGYQFASDPRANIPTRRRRFVPVQVWIIIAVVGATLGILLSSKTSPSSTSWKPGRDMFGRPAKSPSAGAGARLNTPTTSAGPVLVKPGFWPCGSTKDAYWEITKSALTGKAAMFAAMRRTHSFALQDGAQVTVLDFGIAATRVRVIGQLDPGDGRVHAYPEDGRVGRVCWVASEAVAR